MTEKQLVSKDMSSNIIEECCSRTAKKQRYVVGHITAVSHVFKVVPSPITFVEVVCKKKVHQIGICQKNLQNVSQNFKFGQLGKFTEIFKVKQKMSNNEFIMTSSKSQVSSYSSINSSLQSRYGLINVERFIASDNRDSTVLSKILHIVMNDDGPELKYNYYMLKHIKYLLTFNRIGWLKNQLEIFERKFTNEFLSSHNIISDGTYDVREKLLTRASNQLFPNDIQGDRLLSNEFICDPHKCIVTHGDSATPPSFEPIDHYAVYPTLDELSNFEPHPKGFWKFYSRRIEGGVVGVLRIDPQCGCWEICDSTCSMLCLITGDMLSIAKLYGVVVLFIKCLLIVEIFGDLSSKRYFYVAAEDIRLIQNPGLDSEEAARVVPVFKDETTPIVQGINFLNKKIVTACTKSWIIMILHKMNVMKPSTKVICSMKVNLLGRANTWDFNSSRENNNFTVQKDLLLEGKLIQYIPILQNQFSEINLCIGLYHNMLSFLLNKKAIMVKLADSAFENDNSVPLYLSKWKSSVYPMGLLPGANIHVSSVSMSRSKKSGAWYFSATMMTTIEVLEIDIKVQIPIYAAPVLENWGPSCILTKHETHMKTFGTMWAVMDGIKFRKLKASVSCTNCNGQFTDMSCSGCDIFPISPFMEISAICIVEDNFGKVFINIKNEHLRDLLGVSEQCWELLAKLATLDGEDIEVTYNEEIIWGPEDSTVKKVLMALISSAELQQRHFHIKFQKRNLALGAVSSGRLNKC
ncbi:hypothetical protein C0J52_13068 [Blattella germanica]|nr:hypothetical protein C0J52_13068 [Blattella germanica]